MGDEPQVEDEPATGSIPSEDDASAEGAIQPDPSPAEPDLDYEQQGSLVAEFVLFLKEEKRWWLTPMVVVLLLIAGLFMFVEGSVVAPFIYTIF